MIRDVPADVRKAIADDATSSGISFQYAASKILADAYGVKMPEPDYRGGVDVGGGSENVLLRIPAELRTRIKVAAARLPGGTVRGIAIAAFAEHFGMDAPPPTRRARGTVKA